MAKRALGQDSRVGHVLGHYRIVEKIGEGTGCRLFIALTISAWTAMSP